MKVKFLFFIVIVLLAHSGIYSQKLVVGEDVFLSFNSPHPVRGAVVSNEVVWSQDIVYTAKYASYLAVHFEQ